MCLHIKLALLNMLLQLSICLVLCPGQLQHRLSNWVESILKSRCIQCYLGSLHYCRSYWSRGSLRAWWSLSTRGSRGSFISRGSSTIRGSSIIRSSSWVSSSSWGSYIGISSPRGSSIGVSSLIRWCSILIWMSPSLRRSPISMWPSTNIIIITTFYWIFPPSWYGGFLYICASSGIFSSH